MKADRKLIRLLTSNKLDVDRIAAKLKTSPASIVRTARRLGIYLPSVAPKRHGPKYWPH
jgi:hypothetical protein